jgi:hypothetical protein
MKELELKIKMLELKTKRAETGIPVSDTDDIVHPHHVEKMHEAAKVYDLASRRNAAPKRIVRGPDGKASHIVTDFQE